MAETTAEKALATARKTTPRKPLAKKAAPVAIETNAVAFALEPAGSTKTYAKFTFPEGSGCVGTVYAPLGTKTVKVRLES